VVSTRRSWWLGALVLTSACNLNPRPEDPGANKGFNGDNSSGHGAGGATTSPPPKSSMGGASDAGVPTIPPPPGESLVPEAGAAGDAGADSGPAKPDAPIP
jgi:hypothetical protein